MEGYSYGKQIAMPASPEQITALLSKYEAVIKRQAAEKKELEKIIDLLESNSRIQAKLLADTGRERDEIRIQLDNANRALEVFADSLSWRLDGSCDPNSSRFEGTEIARSALTRK